MDTFLSKYAIVIQTIYWFAYLQMLWLIFSLAGLVVFGVFPATYALLSVWKQESLTSKQTFQIFCEVFRRSFFVMNGAGILYGVMAGLISMNLLFIEAVYIRLLVLAFLGLIFLSIVHFLQYFERDKPLIHQVKRAFLLLWMLPKSNVGHMGVLVGMLLLVAFMPGLALFFGMSAAMFLVNKIGYSKESEQLQHKLKTHQLSAT